MFPRFAPNARSTDGTGPLKLIVVSGIFNVIFSSIIVQVLLESMNKGKFSQRTWIYRLRSYISKVSRLVNFVKLSPVSKQDIIIADAQVWSCNIPAIMLSKLATSMSGI